MAKDKDRTLNPAAAHLKSEKNKALKKSKAQQSVQRNEKLARRNPERLQRQIDELKETREAQGGQLRPRDKQALEQLERDVKLIWKAREASGSGGGDQQEEKKRDGADRGGRGRGGPASSLGKRRRDWDGHRDQENEYHSDETDPDVRSIPMPRDTPPPVPPRPRRQQRHGRQEQDSAHRLPHALPAKPVAQTTYSSAPQMRDLQKEATSKFVPAAVAARLKQKQGITGGGGGGQDGGRLLEPEEVDALERGGYLDAKGAADEAAKEKGFTEMNRDGAVGVDAGTLEEEELAFERELREADGSGEDSSIEEESNQRDAERSVLEHSSKRDAEQAAEAAADEEAHNLIAKDSLGQRTNPSRRLRHVEIEEVEDEDL